MKMVAGGDRRPSELLEALDGLCFYRVEDWWTYELCYKKAVRQFHKEGDALTAEFRLGTYDAEASDLDRVHHDAAAAPADAKFVSQVYAGGEPCDVTGAPRQTEVRFGIDNMPSTL
ncbi:hypothetical protein WJX81_007190 [Elliptochloris bilobata]|uniref:MRH domain-containing protein n=1 Tax=Elliptochloris bilobata TaxID=381761 RepID=A0AAW1SJR7_9CHLO